MKKLFPQFVALGFILFPLSARASQLAVGATFPLTTAGNRNADCEILVRFNHSF